MKNFTRIFFAVAALFALACTTDATQDLGVRLEGQTTVTLSLEESRTQLGEAVAGLYPVTWSAGDAISINGVASSAIEIADNQAVAKFTFNEALTYPYAIAYPAAVAGKVVFADQQVHTVGTFANGAAVMYGYAEAEGAVSLNHLTGVLKIGVTGDKILSFAQISTVDRAPIAGQFGLDFATGELTATDASKELISYSFGDGLALSADAQYIHATVPAGEYDELYVTLYDTEGGVMYATVKADDSKPLAAGKVREFSNTITYTPNATVFVIRDVASLKAFGEQAATLEKDALFVADVDMTGETWTPIEGYAKTVLGNGYSIKGMTAPLFGTTSASIKGLHLKDVVLASNNAPIVGGLVCVAVATETIIPTIEHCSVNGTLVVDNQEYTPTGNGNDIEMNYAGIVAQSQGAQIRNCVNDVAITVNQVAVMGNTANLRPYIGGIVGNAYGLNLTNGYIYTHIGDCVNNADILYKDICCTADALVIYPVVGGITGGMLHNTALASNSNKISEVGTTLANCTNHGNISILANGGGAGKDTQSYPYTHAAGIAARAAYCSITDCDNHGTITLDGKFDQTFSGGICGASWYTNLENCDNYGAVTVTKDSIFRGIMLAGISANNYSEGSLTYYTKNCSNNAPVTCLGSTDPAAPTGGSYHYRIGGCEGFGRSSGTNIVNNKEGVVTCEGNIIYLTKSSFFCQIGGTTAYRTTRSHTGSCNYADVNVNINFSIHADVEDDATKVTDRSLMIGGVCGYTTQSANGSENKGNITVRGSYGGKRFYIGGVVGYGGVVTAENHGTIDIDLTSTTSNGMFVGGVLAGSDASGVATDVRNEGDITVAGKHKTIAVGGIGGQNRQPHNGAVNNGDITVTATCTDATTVGGVIAYHVRQYYKSSDKKVVMEGSAGALSDCVNNGKITLIPAETAGGALYAGGVARQGQHNMYRCINNGEIVLGGACLGSIYVGGMITVNSACIREDCVNNGNITVSTTSGGPNNTGSDVFIGGMCYSGGSNTTYRRCINKGNILFTGSAANCARFGGMIANIETTDKKNIFEQCVNNGNIEMAGLGSAHSGGTMRYGGLCAQFTKGTMEIIGGYKNTGNITFSGTQNSTTGISIGGIIGGNDGSSPVLQNCSGVIINEGKLSFTGKSKGATYIGGIAPYYNNGTFFTNTVKLINTGDIYCTGTSDSGTCTLSGIVGSINTLIDGAQCFCNIYAPLYGVASGSRTAATFALLSKNARSAGKTQYTNAKVGGTICKNQTSETFEDADGSITTTVTDEIITIDASNFFNYMYGSVDWAGVENYDGCTVISSKEEIDYTAPALPEVPEESVE